ncbi:hypothetical protein ACJX0J_036900, partial [Zea mays]
NFNQTGMIAIIDRYNNIDITKIKPPHLLQWHAALLCIRGGTLPLATVNPVVEAHEATTPCTTLVTRMIILVTQSHNKIKEGTSNTFFFFFVQDIACVVNETQSGLLSLIIVLKRSTLLQSSLVAQ